MGRISKLEQYQHERIAREVRQSTELTKTYRKVALETLSLAIQKLSDANGKLYDSKVFGTPEEGELPKELELSYNVTSYLHLVQSLLEKAEELDSE